MRGIPDNHRCTAIFTTINGSFMFGSSCTHLFQNNWGVCIVCVTRILCALAFLKGFKLLLCIFTHLCTFQTLLPELRLCCPDIIRVCPIRRQSGKIHFVPYQFTVIKSWFFPKYQGNVFQVQVRNCLPVITMVIRYFKFRNGVKCFARHDQLI